VVTWHADARHLEEPVDIREVQRRAWDNEIAKGV
jgi:hypothetical protein